MVGDRLKVTLSNSVACLSCLPEVSSGKIAIAKLGDSD